MKWTKMKWMSGLLAMVAGTLAVMGLAAAGDAAPAAAKPEQEKKVLQVTVTVPTSGWKFTIDEVFQIGEELWAIARLQRPKGAAMQVISKATAKLDWAGPELPVHYVVIGHPHPPAKPEPNVEYVKSRDDLKEKLAGAKALYPPPAPDAAK
jgi:hypothetical protein